MKSPTFEITLGAPKVLGISRTDLGGLVPDFLASSSLWAAVVTPS